MKAVLPSYIFLLLERLAGWDVPACTAAGRRCCWRIGIVHRAHYRLAVMISYCGSRRLYIHSDGILLFSLETSCRVPIASIPAWCSHARQRVAQRKPPIYQSNSLLQMTAVVAPGRKMGCSKLNFTNITTSSLATDSRRVSVKEHI